MESERYALVNFSSGRAVVFEADGTSWKMSVLGHEVEGPTLMELGFHTIMWLYPGGCERVDPGEAPYGSLKQTMVTECRVRAAMTFFLGTLDREIGRGLRERSASLLNRYLADDSIFAAVLERVLSVPIPPDASTHDAPFTGRGAKVFAAMIERYGHTPDRRRRE